MAGNTIGTLFKLTSFGESHGPAIGGIIDGCPAGLDIDMSAIETQLNRRKTGSGPAASTRLEDDTVEILSGIFKGKTTGTPIGFIIRNKDQKPEDYDHLEGAFRPSHADYTYEAKYGFRDHRGGGRSSARETAIRVVAGAIASALLETKGVFVRAYVSQIGPVTMAGTAQFFEPEMVDSSPVRCPEKKTSDAMISFLDDLKKAGDTVGGTITCVVTGTPPGLGEPVFDRFEADLAKAVMSINAVKGFDIGSGYASASAWGSELNDPFRMENGKVRTTSNHSGGVQGGITNGEDIYFRAFFKPVATLMKDQVSVDRNGKEVVLKGKGRHDVCVVPRAVPIIEAMTAITLADLYLRNLAARI